MPKLYNIEIDIHQEITTSKGPAYRAKVLLPDLGLFINGFMIYQPNPEFPDWGVQPPKVPKPKTKVQVKAKKNKYITEFNHKMPLWLEIEEACVNAGKLEWQNSKDEVVIEDIDDMPISLDDIPF